MAEIPSSWGVKAVPTGDGKIALQQKCDNGSIDTIRKVDAVTDDVVADLAAGDRERTDARAFTRRIVNNVEQNRQEFADNMLAEYEEAALPVAWAGLHKHESTVGLSGVYERGARYFAWKKSLGLG